MPKINMTQQQFDKLVDSLNHKVTKLETNVAWLSKIMGYMATLMTGMFVTGLGILFTLMF
jgi:hypothetical protein